MPPPRPPRSSSLYDQRLQSALEASGFDAANESLATTPHRSWQSQAGSEYQQHASDRPSLSIQGNAYQPPSRHPYHFPSTPGGTSTPGAMSPFSPGTPQAVNPFASTQSFPFHVHPSSPTPSSSESTFFNSQQSLREPKDGFMRYSDRENSGLYDKEMFTSSQPLADSFPQVHTRISPPKNKNKSCGLPAGVADFKKRKPGLFWISVTGALIVIIAAVAVPVVIVLQHSQKTTSGTKGISSNDAAASSGSRTQSSSDSSATSSSKYSSTYASYSSSQTQLFFPPSISGGTGLNGPFAGGQASILPYTQLLAFGSSYSDNGHERASQYSESIAPSDKYWNRRWSNGPNWTEYLRDYLGNVTNTPVQHWNYAFGGATTNNSIHGTKVPDTGEQINFFLRQRGSSLQTSKSLVVLFTSTNDVMSAFNNYWMTGQYNMNDVLDQVRRAATSLTNELRWLIPNATDTNATPATTSLITGTAVPQPTMVLNGNAGSYRSTVSWAGVAPDFLVLPIVPCELTPSFQGYARDAGVDITVVTQMSRTYNTALMAGARDLASALGSRGQVFTYDVPTWFYSMFTAPSKYGLTNIQDGCQYTGCSTPGTYVFWDTLHLVTSIQSRLATTVMQMVLNGIS